MTTRSLLSALLVALAIASVPSLGAAQSAPTARPDISGVWQTKSYSPRIKTVDGGDLPFTPEGLAAYKQNIAGLKDGTLTDDARRVCLPPGVPRIVMTPYPFQILQNAEYLAILYEENHVFRNVLMEVPPAGVDELEAYPYYSGTSYGRWEGDALVIETRGFNESTFIDATGVPHSSRLNVTERLRKVNGGKQLENLVTVEDPAIFTKPWTARFVYESRPTLRLDTSYTCGELHRDLSDVEGASRF